MEPVIRTTHSHGSENRARSGIDVSGQAGNPFTRCGTAVEFTRVHRHVHMEVRDQMTTKNSRRAGMTALAVLAALVVPFSGQAGAAAGGTVTGDKTLGATDIPC